MPPAPTTGAEGVGDLERFEEAVADLGQAMAIEPDDEFYRSSRGRVLCKLKKFGEALSSITPKRRP